MSGISIVVTKLKGEATVTDLCPATHVFPVQLPQMQQPPAIIVNLTSKSDGQHLAGANRYYRDRISVECIALTATEAHDIGEAVLDFLNGIINDAVAGCRDINILFADFDMTVPDDARTVEKRELHFYVMWRK